MVLRRASALAVLMLSLGSAAAFVSPNSLLPQAAAQNTEEQRSPMRGKARLVQELNLSPEQTRRLEAIQTQYRDQISQRKQAARQAEQELRALLAGTASTEQIRDKYRQVETLKREAAQVRFDSMLAMRDVLTPEQRRQFAERMQNRWENHRNRKG